MANPFFIFLACSWEYHGKDLKWPHIVVKLFILPLVDLGIITILETQVIISIFFFVDYNLNLFLCGLGYKILNDPISYCHLWLIFLYIVGRQWKIDQYVVAGFRNVSHKNALLMKKWSDSFPSEGCCFCLVETSKAKCHFEISTFPTFYPTVPFTQTSHAQLSGMCFDSFVECFSVHCKELPLSQTTLFISRALRTLLQPVESDSNPVHPMATRRFHMRTLTLRPSSTLSLSRVEAYYLEESKENALMLNKGLPFFPFALLPFCVILHSWWKWDLAKHSISPISWQTMWPNHSLQWSSLYCL